ncbi:MAG TPA: hypothetical protein PLM25_06020 [Limnochordia bacterium]|nr:hypothetical protein [Limnochordia bacterium]
MAKWQKGFKTALLGLFTAAALLCSLWFSGAASAAAVGIYAGGHETAGMGGLINYTYTVELKADGSYELKSYFVVGDALYDFVETGTYQVDGSRLVLVPEGEDALEGTVNADGSITVPVKPSQMARQRTESTLVLTDNPAAGIYRATLQGPTTVEATLYLNAQGGYYYLAVPGNNSEAVHEQGFYSVQGSTITFTTSAGEVFTGTLGENTVRAPFVVAKVMGIRVEIELAR